MPSKGLVGSPHRAVKVEEIGKANDDLNNLIASTDIATIFVDSGLRIKRFTPRAADLFSIIASDIGRSLLDLTHRLDYDQLAEDVGTTFDTLRLVEREVRSNEGRCYIVRLLPYRTNEDRIEGAVMTFFDISARREAEEQARASEARLRMAADSAGDYAIITLDEEGRVTSWNKGAHTLFGYSAEEMQGKACDCLFIPEDIAAGVPGEELRRAREEGRAEDERWHQRKDDSFLGYAKIARDVTRREQAASDREAAVRSDAQSAAALKDEFLSVMSHELRHPLNMSNINVELLSRMPEIRRSPATMRAAAVIRNAVMSQAKIIDDLLDMSRVRTGKLSLSMAPVALGHVVAGIAEVERADPAARELTIEVVNEADGLYVMADVVRIEQVVLNLLSNAVKFTPAGGASRCAWLPTTGRCGSTSATAARASGPTACRMCSTCTGKACRSRPVPGAASASAWRWCARSSRCTAAGSRRTRKVPARLRPHRPARIFLGDAGHRL